MGVCHLVIYCLQTGSFLKIFKEVRASHVTLRCIVWLRPLVLAWWRPLVLAWWSIVKVLLFMLGLWASCFKSLSFFICEMTLIPTLLAHEHIYNQSGVVLRYTWSHAVGCLIGLRGFRTLKCHRNASAIQHTDLPSNAQRPYTKKTAWVLENKVGAFHGTFTQPISVAFVCVWRSGGSVSTNWHLEVHYNSKSKPSLDYYGSKHLSNCKCEV